MVADRWFPSSKTCHVCGHVQEIGWAEHWQCDSCSASHQRDDCAAINLARYEDTSSVVGPVGAAVKRGADRKTRPGRAGGREARKEAAARLPNNPRRGASRVTTKDHSLATATMPNQGSSNKVYVIGVGMTKFEKPGRREGWDYPDMARSRAPKRCATPASTTAKLNRATSATSTENRRRVSGRSTNSA